MTKPTPTPAQRRLLLALIEAGGTGYTSELARPATTRACRANGWIRREPAGPFEVAKHRITFMGRAAVEHKARPAAERARIAQEGRSAAAARRRLEAAAAMLREAGTITVSVHDGMYFHVTAPCGHSWPGMRHTDDVRIVLDRAMDHACDQEHR